MGIPYYFSVIAKQYPNICTGLFNPINYDDKTVYDLFLDYNNVIHNAIREVLDLNKDKTDKTKEGQLYEAIWSYTQNIVIACSQQYIIRTIYLMIDGIAPRAKMIQQRKRRYLNIFKGNEDKDDRSVPLFDTNQVSPCTPFMTGLEQYLTEKISGSKDHKYKLSPSTERGEGEHKMFDLINKDTDKTDVLIYGLDADLIMLSMLSIIRSNKEERQIRLVRDNTHLNVNALIEGVKHTCVNIKDYIVLCFLLGNDFLPNVLSLHLRESGIQLIMNAYNKVGKPLTYIDGKEDKWSIDWSVLALIVQELSKGEADRLLDKNNEWLNKPFANYKQDDLHYYPLHTNNRSTHKLANLMSVCPQKWRPNYYKYLFNTNYADTSIVKIACQQYIQGIQWTFDYYQDSIIKGQGKANWSYIWSYAPTLGDLANYLLTFTDKEDEGQDDSKDTKDDSDDKEDYTKDEDKVDSYVQLLAILPPSSLNNLNISDLTMISKSPLIKHLYTKTYYIETYLKTALHECSPLLPPIDFTLLKKVVTDHLYHL